MKVDEIENVGLEAEREITKWWFRQRDPVAKFTGWLGVFTGLLVIATALNAYVLVLTDHTLKDTVIASSRAWVVPTGARIDGTVAVDVPLRFKITYENVGKEVAEGMMHVSGGG